MVMLQEITSIIIHNRKVFIKSKYNIDDIVWWYDETIHNKICGKVADIDEYYCYIVDEYNNQYTKPHILLFLEESSIIQTLLNEIYLLKIELMKHYRKE
jgi:hypothetical protein